MEKLPLGVFLCVGCHASQTSPSDQCLLKRIWTGCPLSSAMSKGLISLRGIFCCMSLHLSLVFQFVNTPFCFDIAELKSLSVQHVAIGFIEFELDFAFQGIDLNTHLITQHCQCLARNGVCFHLTCMLILFYWLQKCNLISHAIQLSSCWDTVVKHACV